MQRHRNSANGYRSSPIGIGGGGGGGGPGYRSYSRGGFGRGQPPPPRRIDVFMEAGKLAAEYLISKGLLPPNSVNGRWQNSNLKNQISGGGDGVSDAVSVRRRFPDDYSSATGSKDGIRARRTMESLKSPAVELNREVNRSSLVSEKVKGSSDKQGDGDSFSGSMEEQKNGKDGGTEDRKSVSGDLDSKSYDAGNVDTAIMNQENESPGENAGLTPISEERIDASKNINTSTDDVEMDDGNREPENPVFNEDPPEEDNNKTPNNNSSDLLTLIRFNKIPTRTRSSMTLKGSKSDPVLISGDENQNKKDGENQVLNDEPKLKIEQVSSEDDHKYEFGQGLHMRSLSFPQRSSIADQESSEGHHAYARSSSALLGGGEKRPLQANDSTEAAKKPRDWASAKPQADDYLYTSSSIDRTSSQEGTPGITQPCNSYAEEKQFFPSSFKICDLNLMEVSGVHDNHDTNSVVGFSSVGQAKQEPVSVDFDLTMNNSCDITDKHGKGVEVIDLDCDCMQEDDGNDDNNNNSNNNNNNSDRREEAIFTDLESFPDSMRRVSDMPQESYGLMISELLDADIPNSSASTGVNPMHNELSLPNDEGMLGDDESIYMSLGEIPISFVPVWDQQPSQGYDKRY